MTYLWYFGDLRTGKISRGGVDLIDHRWSVPFDGPGSLEGSYPLRAKKADGAGPRWPDARADAAPAKQFMAVSHVDANRVETFLEGGPIWTTHYDDSTGVLKIGAAGLWSYFDHRKVIPVLAAADNPALASVTYTSAELSLQAKRLVELAATHTGGDLPIVLPTDADLGGAGDTYTYTYPGYEMAWIGERLKQLGEAEGGPEIQFIPRRRADDPRFIEWVMRIGVQPTMMLTQAGPDWVFDRTVPKGPVTEISVDTDGSRQTFRSWAQGDGDATGKLVVRDEDMTLVDDGWPLLEDEVTSTDNLTDRATLTRIVAEGVAIGRKPLETISMKVNRDARPNVGQYRPGDFATIRIAAHDYLPDGDIDVRILALSGDTSDDVSLALAEAV